MSENNDYDRKRTASKKPVTILLALLLVAGVAAAIYETSDRPRATGTTSTPTPANPNILVPPQSGSGSPTPP